MFFLVIGVRRKLRLHYNIENQANIENESLKANDKRKIRFINGELLLPIRLTQALIMLVVLSIKV